MTTNNKKLRTVKFKKIDVCESDFDQQNSAWQITQFN